MKQLIKGTIKLTVLVATIYVAFASIDKAMNEGKEAIDARQARIIIH